MAMRFHVGSDHGGMVLLDDLGEALGAWEVEILSRTGPRAAGDKADYPEVAAAVCRKVLADRAAGHDDVFGLLVCGTGQGVAMTANKLAGIRAGVVGDSFSARMIRAHNDANVICMGERVIGTELARVLLRTFIDAAFEGGRHARRVGLMASLTGGRIEGEGSTGEGS